MCYQVPKCYLQEINYCTNSVNIGLPETGTKNITYGNFISLFTCLI